MKISALLRALRIRPGALTGLLPDPSLVLVVSGGGVPPLSSAAVFALALLERDKNERCIRADTRSSRGGFGGTASFALRVR